MNWSMVGAILMCLSVVLGAFGAHGLRSRLDAYSMDIFKTATLYLMIHALAILVVQAYAIIRKNDLNNVNIAFFLGCLLFSGSLYVLSISGIRWLGAVTPFGGICFIVGWAALALNLSK